MKKKTLLGFVAAVMTAFAVTSCDSNSSSFEWPTLEQSKSMVSNLGYYQDGNLVFYNEDKNNSKDVLDTIPNITASITQSTSKDEQGNVKSYYATATFNYPVKILAGFISDEKLSKAISEMESTRMSINLIPYQYAYQSFIANPTEDIKLGDITVDDKTYKEVTIKFYINYYLAGYETNSSTQKQYFMFYMCPAAIYVNNAKTDYLQAKKFGNQEYPPLCKFTTDK